MAYSWVAVLLLFVLVFLCSLIALPFRTLRRKAKWGASVSAVGLIVSFVLVGQAEHEARKLGFLSAADRRSAGRATEDGERRIAAEKIAEERRRVEQAKADRRAAEEKLAEEQRATEQAKADAVRRAAEEKLAEEQPATEQAKADAVRRAAEEKLAEDQRCAQDLRCTAEKAFP